MQLISNERHDASWLTVIAGEQSHAVSNKKTRLLALTEWGNVSLWSVHVVAPEGPGLDPGLQIGGRVCLMLLADSLPLGRSPPVSKQALLYVQQNGRQHNQHRLEHSRHAAALALLPDSADEFLVGMHNAQILRGSLYGETPVPKVQHSRVSVVYSWQILTCCPINQTSCVHLQFANVKLLC